MKQLRAICILLLAVPVFLMQGLPIHVHTYDHVPGQSDHVHQGSVHFDYGMEQRHVHPDESAPIKIYEYGVLKNISFMALLGACFVIAFISLRAFLVFRPRIAFKFSDAVNFNLGLVPPMRAPPL